jgi:hypothetical protein
MVAPGGQPQRCEKRSSPRRYSTKFVRDIGCLCVVQELILCEEDMADHRVFSVSLSAIVVTSWSRGSACGLAGRGPGGRRRAVEKVGESRADLLAGVALVVDEARAGVDLGSGHSAALALF